MWESQKCQANEFCRRWGATVDCFFKIEQWQWLPMCFCLFNYLFVFWYKGLSAEHKTRRKLEGFCVSKGEIKRVWVTVLPSLLFLFRTTQPSYIAPNCWPVRRSLDLPLCLFHSPLPHFSLSKIPSFLTYTFLASYIWVSFLLFWHLDTSFLLCTLLWPTFHPWIIPSSQVGSWCLCPGLIPVEHTPACIGQDLLRRTETTLASLLRKTQF